MSNHTQNGPRKSLSGRTLGGQPGSMTGWGGLLAACGLVVTGHLLGVVWLSESVLGLPAGLWCIGLAMGIWSDPIRRGLAVWAERIWGLFEHAGRATAIEAGDTPEHTAASMGWWPRHPVASVCVDALTRSLACLVRFAWLPIWGGELSVAGDLRQRFERWLERAAMPTRPFRIGLCMPDDEAEALVNAEGVCRVEWFRLSSWEDPQSACRKHLFDAVVFHDGEGPIRVVTLERPGYAAGVVEWADLRGELTFGRLFPSRVDPAAVVLEGATRTRVREGADLLRALVESAAVLARSERRLSLADRVLGRRPTDVIERPSGLSLWRSRRSMVAVVITHMVHTASKHAAAWPECADVAAEIGSAFFMAMPDMEPSERREGMLEAAKGGTVSAMTALRLGAACIGALEDDEGMDWLVRADGMLRNGSTPLATLDHAAFLESELVCGSENPMSVGRAAAGICLVCAATDPDRVRFLRDDMLEEMAYAGWLVGRDQDRGVLIRVFLEIEHAHDLEDETTQHARKPKHQTMKLKQSRPSAA